MSHSHLSWVDHVNRMHASVSKSLAAEAEPVSATPRIMNRRKINVAWGGGRATSRTQHVY